jgi:catechol 2,3-dioxygenase-like lactoylglutathione lyase family enzyme
VAITHLFLALPVSDLEPAFAWYERLLGRPPDMRPDPGERVWRLTGSGSIYVVADEAHAGMGAITVAVDDLERWRGELDGRGIEVAARDTWTGSLRTVELVDPAGNRVTFFEDPAGSGG